MPHGLLAKVAGVPLCSDTQIHEAEAGTGGCPESSLVGSVRAGVGPGPNSLFVSGKAYLTGPYNGGSYGLAVIVPAVAGPYNFGTVVVRQSLRIDPHTARVTDVSDPFPKIIDGIPLRLRRVDVKIDRPEFAFNPTNCSKLEFNGTITGAPLEAPTSLKGNVGYATQTGASSSFATPFEVTDCASLKFAPKFSASSAGKTSKSEGASLKVKLTFPGATNSGSSGNGPSNGQANVAYVKVQLPKALPSRVSTLIGGERDSSLHYKPRRRCQRPREKRRISSS